MFSKVKQTTRIFKILFGLFVIFSCGTQLSAQEKVHGKSALMNAKPGQIFVSYSGTEKYCFNEDGSKRTKEEAKEAVYQQYKAKKPNLKREDVFLVTRKAQESVIGKLPKAKTARLANDEIQLIWGGMRDGGSMTRKQLLKSDFSKITVLDVATNKPLKVISHKINYFTPTDKTKQEEGGLNVFFTGKGNQLDKKALEHIKKCGKKGEQIQFRYIIVEKGGTKYQIIDKIVFSFK